jgi:hypothetical protein
MAIMAAPNGVSIIKNIDRSNICGSRLTISQKYPPHLPFSTLNVVGLINDTIKPKKNDIITNLLFQ